MQFTFSLGGALSLCIAQTIFVNSLTRQVSRNMSGISVDQVTSAGAYGLSTLAAGSPEILLLLKNAYRHAIRDVFFFALGAAALAFVFSFGFEHRNIKHEAKQREDLVGASTSDSLQKE